MIGNTLISVSVPKYGLDGMVVATPPDYLVSSQGLKQSNKFFINIPNENHLEITYPCTSLRQWLLLAD